MIIQGQLQDSCSCPWIIQGAILILDSRVQHKVTIYASLQKRRYHYGFGEEGIFYHFGHVRNCQYLDVMT